MLKKKLKGFTLVEMIIALGVFMVMSLVLCLAVSMTSKMIIESQFTSEKAAGQGYYAAVVNNASMATADDTVTSAQTITVNGVDLTNITVVEIEGTSTYAGSPTDSQYVSAPNIKVFIGS